MARSSKPTPPTAGKRKAGKASAGRTRAALKPPRPALAPGWTAVPNAPPPRLPEARQAVEEPVWLVRIVLLLFFVGFAAFLAREVYLFVKSFG